MGFVSDFYNNHFLYSLQMLIDISDENNNPPIFPKSSMRLPASESLAVGAEVATVKATDPDTDDVLTYSLSLKNGDLGTDFVIDSATAVITVGPSGLDRERKSEYQLEGELQLFTNCQFQLSILRNHMIPQKHPTCRNNQNYYYVSKSERNFTKAIIWEFTGRLLY